MATAFRPIAGGHEFQAAELVLPDHPTWPPGPLAQLRTMALSALKRLHARYRADTERLPMEYWSWWCC